VSDRAGRSYWDQLWDSTRAPVRRMPLPWLRAHWRREFARYFRGVFENHATEGLRLLEIGCAQSPWLPFFATEFGFSVAGLDYSAEGCRQAVSALDRAGVQGEIVCTDLFTPPDNMLGSFDVVVSFGVVEHFDDTAGCVAAAARFLKPGGMLITSIPNMTGLVGAMQRALNRPVFDVHVPLDADQLRQAVVRAGLDVISCDYFMSVNLAVCNLKGVDRGSLTFTVKRMIMAAANAVTAGAWLIEEAVGRLPASHVASPYINCLARRPPLATVAAAAP
jgi:2-polyprenyl-3-methyl-5-hydroxy-6-metoxy-1,4-benzoquinol methylase